jgi:hypothetical protein
MKIHPEKFFSVGFGKQPSNFRANPLSVYPTVGYLTLSVANKDFIDIKIISHRPPQWKKASRVCLPGAKVKRPFCNE